jgi:hypothetical protein
MGKVKVTVKLDFPKLLKDKLVNQELSSNLADVVIKGILEHTAIGLSPVRGFGRFVGYKAQEEAKKLKKIATHLSRANNKAAASSARSEAKSSARGYPSSVQGRFPDKKVRPVNLRLTGTMLADLSYLLNRTAQKVTIGIFKGKSKLKAETHNEGTQEPNVPTRQFLPTTQGQEFTVSIMRAIKEVYRKRLNSIIEESNK